MFRLDGSTKINRPKIQELIYREPLLISKVFSRKKEKKLSKEIESETRRHASSSGRDGERTRSIGVDKFYLISSSEMARFQMGRKESSSKHSRRHSSIHVFSPSEKQITSLWSDLFLIKKGYSDIFQNGWQDKLRNINFFPEHIKFFRRVLSNRK
ncbi:hypothetical protein TNIN_308261 [Trichonephila inaurata madagascariensis]|uniref:Uncharacterized protein n=1 Tax=Trichonephila inaurata madagascariensis TaxID=2747483 RepID=A0A8X7BR15_9ARAC|nr:hypothetical protein TNIN_308261 [Trichonephila inaurata madagascariensis]